MPQRKPAVSVISFAETRVARPLAKLGLRTHRAVWVLRFAAQASFMILRLPVLFLSGFRV